MNILLKQVYTKSEGLLMPDFSVYAFACVKLKSKDTPLFVWIQTRLFCLCLYLFWHQYSLNQCQNSLCAVTHSTGIRNHNSLFTDAGQSCIISAKLSYAYYSSSKNTIELKICVITTEDANKIHKCYIL